MPSIVSIVNSVALPPARPNPLYYDKGGYSGGGWVYRAVSFTRFVFCLSVAPSRVGAGSSNYPDT